MVAVADPDTGVIELRLSNDGATWSGWEGFPSPSPSGAMRVPWALAPGAGAKTVMVEARNGAGLIATFVGHTTLGAASAAGAQGFGRRRPTVRSRGRGTGARSSAATRPT